MEELTFQMDHPTIFVAFRDSGVERQILAGGTLKEGVFSYQGFSPKPLWINLLVTTNEKAKTSLDFFDTGIEESSANHVARLIHKVDPAHFDVLERKLESSALRLTHITVTSGAVTKNRTGITVVAIAMEVGDRVPTHIDTEVGDVCYRFQQESQEKQDKTIQPT